MSNCIKMLNSSQTAEGSIVQSLQGIAHPSPVPASRLCSVAVLEDSSPPPATDLIATETAEQQSLQLDQCQFSHLPIHCITQQLQNEFYETLGWCMASYLYS